MNGLITFASASENPFAGNPFFEFIDNMNLELSAEYLSSAFTKTIAVAVIAFALTLFTAIAIKRARAMGIVTAITQVLGVVGGYGMVRSWSNIDFAFSAYVTGSSQQDVANKAEAILEQYFSETIPQLVIMCISSLLVTLSIIMLLVYVILLMRVKPKVLPVFALIILILRWLCVSPVALPGLLLGMSEDLQRSWDLINYGSILLPLLLLALTGLIALITKNKSARES